MRTNTIWFLIVVGTALIQTTVLAYVRVQGVLPDLMLLLVVYFAIEYGEERAMLTGLIGGVYQDVACGNVLGHYVFCHVALGFACGRVARRLVAEHPAIKVGLVFSASVFHGMLYMFIQYLQNPETNALRLLLATVVPGAFYSALVTPVAFFLLKHSVGPVREPLQGGAA